MPQRERFHLSCIPRCQNRPSAVLVIILREFLKSITCEINAFYIRHQNNFSSTCFDALVQFYVLIANQLLVEISETFKYVPAETTERNRVRFLRFFNSKAKVSITHAETMSESDCDRL